MIYVYYINRCARPDRDLKMREQMKKIHHPWERIEAVEGDVYTLRRFGDKIRDLTFTVQYGGHFGCYLSHLEALSRVAGLGPDDCGIVLEDDVVLVSQFSSRVERFATEPFDMIYLYIPDNRKYVEYYNQDLYRLHYGYEGLYGYMITPAYARFLLSHIRDRPFQQFIDRMVAIVNHQHESVIMCPCEPLLWTDTSMDRDSDTFARSSLQIPLVVHMHGRFPRDDEKPFLDGFEWIVHDTMASCIRAQYETGGFIIPTDFMVHDHLLSAIARNMHAFGFHDSEFSGCAPRTIVEPHHRVPSALYNRKVA